MVEYPSIKDIQHPLECGTPSEMLHYGLEYHCAEYDVLVQKCTKNIISHYTTWGDCHLVGLFLGVVKSVKDCLFSFFMWDIEI